MHKVVLKWYRDMLGQRIRYDQELAIHPLNNGKIIINYPGAEGDIDGYNRKYETLANFIVESRLGAVVRSGNPFVGPWDRSLREMLTYTLRHSKEICGSKIPEIYLMGFSAGAGAICILAWEYPEVRKILLTAPSIRVGEGAVAKGLRLYTGEVYIVIGDSDEIVKPEAGEVFLNLCETASRKELFVINDCDHQFRNEKNGRIMSQAPLYAFSDEKPVFPDDTLGIVLYQ
jgi:hypothetical protein